jgi:predicted PurR-regulated permease PerM
MPFLDTERQRAALLILLLAAGLAITLASYATGLVGAVVLYVMLAPLNGVLRRWIPPAAAASLLTAFAIVLILVPGISFAGLVVNQARLIAGGVVQSPLLHGLATLQIGQFELGPTLVKLGENVVAWIGSSAFGLIGTAARLALNLTIAFFGLYYLLRHPDEAWELARSYIPFSESNAERLRQRFRDVTYSTLLGTVLVAVIQGALVAGAFYVLGLSNALFWGFVTAVFAILPVVGSGLVWVPGAAALILDGRLGAGIALLAWGALVVGTVDNFIRPLVYRRWARIHPMITLVGAMAGVKYFGILGILIGPLTLSYFFELVRMYREEYLAGA